jgi:hypothetical protein
MNPFIQGLKTAATTAGLSEDAYYLQQLVQVSAGGSSSVIDGLITAATTASDSAAVASFTADKSNAKAVGSASAQGLSGLFKMGMAVALYDFGVNGGVQGTIGLGVTLPKGAMVSRTYFRVLTNFDSATQNAFFGFTLENTSDLMLGASAVGPPFVVGVYDGFDTIGNPNQPQFNIVPILTTAAREISLMIGGEDLTAGKALIFLEYFLSE